MHAIFTQWVNYKSIIITINDELGSKQYGKIMDSLLTGLYGWLYSKNDPLFSAFPGDHLVGR